MAHLSSDSPRYNWDANYGGELGIVAYGRTQADVRGQLSRRCWARSSIRSTRTRATTRSTACSARGSRASTWPASSITCRAISPTGRSARRWTGTWWAAASGRSSRAAAPTSRPGSTCSASILKTNVDYDWEMHAGVRVHHRVYGTFGLIGAGARCATSGPNGLCNRGNQTGGRGEGGFRVSGQGRHHGALPGGRARDRPLSHRIGHCQLCQRGHAPADPLARRLPVCQMRPAPSRPKPPYNRADMTFRIRRLARTLLFVALACGAALRGVGAAAGRRPAAEAAVHHLDAARTACG